MRGAGRSQEGGTRAAPRAPAPQVPGCRAPGGVPAFWGVDEARGGPAQQHRHGVCGLHRQLPRQHLAQPGAAERWRGHAVRGQQHAVLQAHVRPGRHLAIPVRAEVKLRARARTRQDNPRGLRVDGAEALTPRRLALPKLPPGGRAHSHLGAVSVVETAHHRRHVWVQELWACVHGRARRVDAMTSRRRRARTLSAQRAERAPPPPPPKEQHRT